MRAPQIVAIVLGLLMWPAAASADQLVVPGGPNFRDVGNETIAFNGHMYFAADDGVTGNELWRTDGTGPGTTLVQDFDTTGPNDDGNPSGFRVAGNRLYFNVGSNDLGGGGLVVYFIEGNAAPQRTSLPNADPANGNLIGTVGSTVLLRQLENANGNYGLYALGGAGSTFADIDAGTDNVSSEPAATLNGFAYFTKAPVGPNGGAELYRTDGATVTRVKDINTTTTSAGSGPNDFVATANRVYFEANNGVNGSELWVTDGTELGTQMVKDHTPGAASTTIHEGAVANGNTLFYAVDDPGTGLEPWRTDGTLAGTSVVKDMTPGPTGSGIPVMAPFGSGFILVRPGNVYTSDGTDAGTIEVADVDSDGRGAVFLGLAGSHAYFGGGFSPFGGAVWRTDGTVAGTGALTAGEFSLTTTGAPDAYPFAALGDKAIFFAHYPHAAGDPVPASAKRMYVLDRAQADTVRQVVVAPSISGTAAVGQPLTGNPGTWTLDSFNRYAFQWLRNGVAIPGSNATVAQYTPVAADDGTQLTVQVTASGLGLPNQVVAVSAPVTVGVLTVNKKPKLKGEARVGKRLKATKPKFAESGVKLKYKWLANGKAIRKQKKSSLKLTNAQEGKRISLKITATLAGYKPLKLKAGPTKKVKPKGS